MKSRDALMTNSYNHYKFILNMCGERFNLKDK